MKNLLLIMAKRPQPDRTKTRMTPPLTSEQAALFYESLLRDTVELARALPNITPAIAFAPDPAGDYFHSLAPDLPLMPQQGHTLGQRLDHVLSSGLSAGFSAVIAMNSDSPTLPPGYLTDAFTQLADPAIDVVLGPTEDGGYYLIGLKTPQPGILRPVQMSTPHVLRDTLALAADLGLRVSLLPPWHDVDTAADLARLRPELADLPPTVCRHTRALLLASLKPGVSCIIPALNEAENIAALVMQLLAQPVDEVIVVDNGSSDDTAERAQKAGARVVVERRRGYGSACAAGVAATAADILLFIDADGSSLPTDLPRLIEPILTGRAELVLGSRELGEIAAGAMLPHQRFGNRLTSWLMRLLYRLPVSDLGPYRAITADLLRALDMQEMTFGWPTEMMVKAARRRAKILEIPVAWQARQGGDSKISGTLRGSLLAAYHILRVTFRYAWGRRS